MNKAISEINIKKDLTFVFLRCRLRTYTWEETVIECTSNHYEEEDPRILENNYFIDFSALLMLRFFFIFNILTFILIDSIG